MSWLAIFVLAAWGVTAFQLLAAFAYGMKSAPSYSATQGRMLIISIVATLLLTYLWLGSLIV